eukprot:TRINITY_DN121176_c0_g1_i1.p1 TRINITY_DN121176_c0_g1~~TRINITY_DN121176_c0_g1_i1.p1  ORF type:complete len:457 (-),score=153.56 TRINITY_DN121176_c0_g1_i1:64-1434(-)
MAKEGTLVDRMGGYQVLEELVYGIYDLMMENPKAKASFMANIKNAPIDFLMKNLKDATVKWCDEAWGGYPEEASDLFEQHAALKISTDVYDVCMKCVTKQLNKMKFNKAMKKELYDAFEGLRDPICDPTGRRDRELRERLAQLEKDYTNNDDLIEVGTMGFFMKRSEYEKLQQREKEAEERKERLAEAAARRKARQSQQQAEAARAARAAKKKPQQAAQAAQPPKPAQPAVTGEAQKASPEAAANSRPATKPVEKPSEHGETNPSGDSEQADSAKTASSGDQQTGSGKQAAAKEKKDAKERGKSPSPSRSKRRTTVSTQSTDSKNGERRRNSATKEERPPTVCAHMLPTGQDLQATDTKFPGGLPRLDSGSTAEPPPSEGAAAAALVGCLQSCEDEEDEDSELSCLEALYTSPATAQAPHSNFFQVLQLAAPTEKKQEFDEPEARKEDARLVLCYL